MAKQKKKTGCLGTVVKVLIVLVVLAAFGAISGGDKTEQPAKTTAPTATPTAAPTNTPEPVAPAQPSIAGSQVYDIVLSLADRGIPKVDPKTSKDAAGNTIYQHASSGMDDSSMISYNITSDRNHAVSYAVFNVSNGEAPWYLPFCASMPYESAEPEKASAFVNDNVNKEAELQIGDAIFNIYPNENGGAMLTITAVGYEEWCLDQLPE